MAAILIFLHRILKGGGTHNGQVEIGVAWQCHFIWDRCEW